MKILSVKKVGDKFLVGDDEDVVVFTLAQIVALGSGECQQALSEGKNVHLAPHGSVFGYTEAESFDKEG